MQTPTVEARAVITLSKIQVAQADSDPLEEWQVIGTRGGVVTPNWQAEGKAKGKNEVSLLTTSTQTTDSHLGGILQPFRYINRAEGAGDRIYQVSRLHQRFRTTLSQSIPKQRKRKMVLGVCSRKCVGVGGGRGGGGWLCASKRKTWNVLSTPSFLMTAEQQCLLVLVILIYDKNQLEQKGYKGWQWKMRWAGEGGKTLLLTGRPICVILYDLSWS